MREAASANARFSSVEAGLDGLIERSVAPPSDESDQDPEAEPEELRALEAATAAKTPVALPPITAISQS